MRRVIVVVRTAAMLVGMCVSTKIEEKEIKRVWVVHARRYSPSDGRPDRVVVSRGGDNEPEQDVDHIHDPNGGIEVQAITEHELPWREGLVLEGLDRTMESEDQAGSIEDRGRGPVDSHPICDRPGDAPLSWEQGDHAIECRCDGHDCDLPRGGKKNVSISV